MPHFYDHPTLFENYCSLNLDFLMHCGETGKEGDFRFHYGMRGVPRIMLTGVQLQASEFGLEKNFPFHEPRRIALLERRYLDQALWDENIKRIQWATSKPTSLFSFPARSYNFLLHRDPSLKRNPRGGGCLLGMALIFDRDHGVPRLTVHVLSRASESVCALYGDFLFVEHLLKRVFEEGKIKLPRAGYQLKIDWTIGIVYQNSVYSPPLLLWLWGPEVFQKWLKGKGPALPKSFWDSRLRRYVNEVSLTLDYGEGNRGRWSRWMQKSLELPYRKKLRNWRQLMTEDALDLDDFERRQKKFGADKEDDSLPD